MSSAAVLRVGRLWVLSHCFAVEGEGLVGRVGLAGVPGMLELSSRRVAEGDMHRIDKQRMGHRSHTGRAWVLAWSFGEKLQVVSHNLVEGLLCLGEASACNEMIV